VKSGDSARDWGLARCHACDLLNRLSTDGSENACARCGTLIHSRKIESLGRTCAYLIAAYVLYVPANVLPIMRTRTLFGKQDDTILSGIIYLWKNGSFGLAVIVFCASIVVPLLKLAALTLLVFSVRFGSGGGLEWRTRLYRVVEVIGRWSMLDVYVLALLTSLVQTPSVAEIRPGPAAIAFASVVVLTLLAARSFDVRLLWDRAASRGRAPASAAGEAVLAPQAGRSP
jgi:paraquat-inducible protein A